MHQQQQQPVQDIIKILIAFTLIILIYKNNIPRKGTKPNRIVLIIKIAK
jgi:hypothetical protein